MTDQNQRTKLVLNENYQKIQSSSIIVFGLGGVGGHATESLARLGVGKITLVDFDVFDETNLNRQILATYDVIGQKKVVVAKERIKQINRDVRVETYDLFYDETTANRIDLSQYDYVIDAIDSLKAKIFLIKQANIAQTKIISCMGTGNKLHPELFEISDIYRTSYDPIARIIRRELKDSGIKQLKVVYSKEQPIKQNSNIVGSVSFVPGVAGMILASAIINDLIKE